MKKLISLVLLAMLYAPAALHKTVILLTNYLLSMHSSPNNVRIIGSVDAGEKITYLQTNKSTGYTRFKTTAAEGGESKFVSTQESMALRMLKLKNVVKLKAISECRQSEMAKAGLANSLVSLLTITNLSKTTARLANS